MLNKNKEFKTFNMSWEAEYGYVQAVKNGDTVWISGQLGHNEQGVLAEGMKNQMDQTYANIGSLLQGFDMAPYDFVEEVIYATDISSAFESRKKIGALFYPDPKRIASTIVEVRDLVLPGQLVEIKIVAKK